MRRLVPLLLAALVEYQYHYPDASGVWAQQDIDDGDNPCYLDAELGCAAEGKTCSLISDLCGGQIDCGVCPDPCDLASPTTECETCEDNECTCLPATCLVLDAECGTAHDFCGGTLPCAAPCFDDPWWSSSGGASCAMFAANPGWDCTEFYAVSSDGVQATDACPVTCQTNCAEFMIDYANIQEDDGRCAAGQYCEGARRDGVIGNSTHGEIERQFVGPSRCVVCGDGFEPDEGQLACVPCQPGSAGTGGICTPCVAFRSRWMEILTPNVDRTACECQGNPGECGATWCGTTPDGCDTGGTIECGGCENLVGGVFGFACSHTLSECECVPDNCEVRNATCGDTVPDGCGGFIECGFCDEKNAFGSNYSCSDVLHEWTVPHLQQANLTQSSHQCVCVPEEAEDLCGRLNTTCGYLPDGCGGEVECIGCGGPGQIPCEISQSLQYAGSGSGGGSWGDFNGYAGAVTWTLNVSVASGDIEAWEWPCDPYQDCSLVGMVPCGDSCVPAARTPEWNSCYSRNLYDQDQPCAM